MATEAREASLEDLLRFPLTGPDWQGRMLIGAGLLVASFLIPFIPAIFVYGYLIRIMHRAIEEGELALPAWEQWGELFREGLRALVVGFTYLLPGMAIFTVGMCLYCGASIMLPLASESPSVGSAEEGLLAVGFMVAIGIFFLSLALGTLLSLLGAIPVPVAAASMLEEDRLGAAYRLRHIVRTIGQNPMSYFAAWVVLFGLMAMTYLLLTFAYYTIVLACLFPLLLVPIQMYAMTVAAGQFGLAYRQSRSHLKARAAS